MIVQDLHEIRWELVDGYVPIQRGYFESYGVWVRLFPGDPKRHLQTRTADAPAAHNISLTTEKVTTACRDLIVLQVLFAVLHLISQHMV